MIKNLFSLVILITTVIQLSAQLKMINYGTPNEFEVATDLLILSDSSKVIVGYKYDALTNVEVNRKNAIILKVDKDDNYMWGYEFSSVNSDHLYVKIASDGDIFFYGYTSLRFNNYVPLSGFVGKMNQATGTILWEREVNTSDSHGATLVTELLELSSGNIIIGGREYASTTSHCTAKSFLVKMNPLGNFINSSVRNYPGNYWCTVSGISQIFEYSLDTLVVIGSQQNNNNARGDGFILKMDTNFNLFNSNRLNFSFTENGATGFNGGLSNMHLINNKLVGIASVHGAAWVSTVSRSAIVKFDIPSFTLEYIKVAISNSTNSSFSSFVALSENDFYFTQASSPQHYSYNSTSLVVGSAQSYITKLSDTTIIATKTLNASGTKGFNKLRFYNNNLYGVGFTHFGNNQIGNQDIFIAQTDTNFTSFEACTFIDSNEISFVDPVMWEFDAIPSAVETYTITLDAPASTKNTLDYSANIQNDFFSIRNECICLYRDTTEMKCVTNPYIAPNGSFISTLGLYEIDYFANDTVCDTIYYADIISFDNTLPIVLCKDDTIYLSSNGQASIDTSNVLDSIYATCGIDQVYLSQKDFLCKDEGDNSVTLYVIDNAGNIDSCISNITVLDTFKFIYIDTIICQGDTLSIMGFDYFETGSYTDTSFGSDSLTSKLITGPLVQVNPVNLASYGFSSPALYNNFTTQGAAIADASANGWSYEYLADPFWRGNGVQANRLSNVLGMWGVGIPNNTWFGAFFPIEVPTSKIYYVVLTADNSFRFTLDGNVQITSNGNAMLAAGQPGGNGGQISFRRVHIYPVFLSAGCHIIGLQGLDFGAPGMFGGAILDNTSAELIAATSMTDLNFIFRTDQAANFYSSLNNFSCPDESIEIDTAVCSDCQSCTRILSVNLVVDTVQTFIIDTALCPGDAILVNGVSYATNQTNTGDTISYVIGGCDSIRYDITLKINTAIPEIIDTTLCIGDALMINGVNYTTNQTNSLDTLAYTISGCDSILYDITIRVDTFRTEIIDTTLCQGDAFIVNGVNYSTNHLNTLDTAFFTMSNCDSILYDITIKIDTAQSEVIDTTLCLGNALMINGISYSTNQTNTLDTLAYTISGCDSILFDITIRVDTFRTEIIDTTLCQGGSFMVNGISYTTNQINTLDTAYYLDSGCDSVLYDVTIQIDTIRTENIDTTLCVGNVLIINGINYSTSQVNTLDTAFFIISGCDSVHFDITVNIDTVVTMISSDTICEGSNLTINGIPYSSTGQYFDTAYYTQSGCDSIHFDISIHVDTVVNMISSDTLCEGSNLTINGISYSATGQYFDTAYYTQSSCDSIHFDISIHLDTVVNMISSDTLCEGSNLTINGIPYSSTGQYFDTAYYTQSGCDSMHFDISIHLDTVVNMISSDTICEGSNLIINGVPYTATGQYFDTAYYTQSGCDSMCFDITIHVDTVVTIISSDTLCEGSSLTINGIPYSSTGQYFDTAYYTQSGCDSMHFDIAIHLDTVVNMISSDTICEGSDLIINGIPYTATGQYFDTAYYTQSGCDSIHFDISIHVDTFRTETLDTAICIGDVLVINGVNYSTTQNNTLDKATYTVSGCDSVLYDITLRINQLGVVGTIPDTIAVCDDLSTGINMSASNITSYQWMVNSGAGFTNVIDGGSFSGAQTNELSINPIEVIMNGNVFRISMFDECGFGPFTDETYLRVTLPHDVLNPIPDITKCLRDSSLLFVDYNGSNYVWDNGQTGQYITVDQAGVYTVEFIENLTNCSMQDEIEIFLNDCVNDCVVALPTGFSPNNTLGKNDVFSIITNCADGFDSYEFSIYDRWGELIFLTNNPAKGWDGTYKGTNLNIGTYVYNLNYVKTGVTERESVSGTVTLIR